MPNLILDSGAVSAFAKGSKKGDTKLEAARKLGLWPPIVPTPVLTECLTGQPTRDAKTNKFLKSCYIDPIITEKVARRAATLRTKAGRGSAVDALLVSLAEPDGVVITSDEQDLLALAANANNVAIEAI